MMYVLTGTIDGKTESYAVADTVDILEPFATQLHIALFASRHLDCISMVDFAQDNISYALMEIDDSIYTDIQQVRYIPSPEGK